VADTEVLLRKKLKASRSAVKGIRTFLNGVDTWDSLRQLTWRWTLGWISFLRDYVIFKTLDMAHREFRKVAALRHAGGHSCNGWHGVMRTAHWLLLRRRNTPERECVCGGIGRHGGKSVWTSADTHSSRVWRSVFLYFQTTKLKMLLFAALRYNRTARKIWGSYSSGTPLMKGACGDAVGWGTALQTGRLRAQFPIVSFEFFYDYGRGVDSASSRNKYQEYFLGGKGGRFVRLTPSCDDCLEIWEPQTP
jgi:hypothetical protein